MPIDCAFSGCSGLEKINVATGNTKYHGVENCLIETEIKTLIFGCKNSIIPVDGSVTSIGDSAFSDCIALTSIEIPNSIISIGGGSFYGCSGLEKINVATGNPIYHSAGNCLIETETKTLIFGCKNSIIPVDGSVTSIGDYAFSGCSALTSIEIPNSIISIGDHAFSRCGLESITIPDGVETIGDWTFSGCGRLENINVAAGNCKYHSTGNCLIKTDTKTIILGCKNSVIPADGSVTSIGRAAFWECSGLTSITIPNGITSIASWAFNRCSRLTSVTMGDSVTAIGYKAFFNCCSLTSVTIPNSVTSIGDAAFGGCSGLTSVTIPNSVTSIGNSAFSGCSGLTSVTIPDSVTSIGVWVFNECRRLTSITIPNSVTSIGDNAFYNCVKLTYNVKGNLKYLGNSENPYLYLAGATSASITEANIDNNCRFIGSDAFYGCSGLTSIRIPDSVTSIGDYAFSGCSGLERIAIGNSVTSIGWYAFKDCSGLTSVTIGNSVTSIGVEAFAGCVLLNKIYYKGTMEEWGKISIYSSNYGNNSILRNTPRYYYSETQPTKSGSFWHYNENGEIEKWQ